MVKSTINFKEDDFDAWNVAYDAACVLDDEIKKSNELLKEEHFKAKGVSGIKNRTEFSKFVKTAGWTPSECKIHISRVAEMISSLGGNNLYGEKDKMKIVLRELLQNARDAICARQAIETASNSDYQGKIIISVNKRDKSYYLSVSDNGIGMSKSTLTTSFLDFGSSFWGSTDVISEFPGLFSSSFKPIGHFGIGFFSVFMMFDDVTISSRRFDGGTNSNINLHFPKGISLTPIVTETPNPNMNVSTVICMKLRKWPLAFHLEDGTKVDFINYIAHISVGLDVDIYFENNINQINGQFRRVLAHQNLYSDKFDKHKWLDDLLSPYYVKFVDIKQYVDSNHKYLRFIREKDRIVGLATLMLPKEDSIPEDAGINPFSYITVGGLYSPCDKSNLYTYVGFLDYEPLNISRRGKSNTYVSEETLKGWALDQMSLIEGSSESEEFKHFYLPQILGQYGIVDPKISSGHFYNPVSREGFLMNVQKCVNFLINGGCFVVECVSKKTKVGKNNLIQNRLEFEQYFYNGKILLISSKQSFYGRYHINGRSKYSFLKMIIRKRAIYYIFCVQTPAGMILKLSPAGQRACHRSTSY